MVSIKEATQNAMRFAIDLLGETRTADLRLEEVDSDGTIGNDYWLITLSLPEARDPEGHSESISAILGNGKGKRDYKVFRVSKDSGEVSAMKIRAITTK